MEAFFQAATRSWKFNTLYNTTLSHVAHDKFPHRNMLFVADAGEPVPSQVGLFDFKKNRRRSKGKGVPMAGSLLDSLQNKPKTAGYLLESV